MTLRNLLAATICTSALTMVPPAMASENPAFDRAVAAVQERMAKIDAVEGVIPGRAFVAVEAGSDPIVDVRGITRIEGGNEMTGDTPVYIASMTKAFVGLMAVRLDDDGVMPLDGTLADYFPDMQVDGVDLSAVTMKDLLSHQLGFRARALNIRTAYTDLVPISEYSAIVSAGGVANDAGFAYDNLGYLLYGAALEKRTGKSWRNWIDDMVFDPLGMNFSSARPSDFDEVTWLHVKQETGLELFPPKSDAIMHAAGGLVISGNDMASWLKANVGGKSEVDSAQFAKAQTSLVDAPAERGPMRCTGYTFGWRKCEMAGVSFLAHGGGYTGMRGQMVVMPGEGVGFAFLFNSDSMTGGLSERLSNAFIMRYADADASLPTPDEFVSAYSAQVERLGKNRAASLMKERADEKWGGWNWSPNTNELIAYTGRYRHAALGIVSISFADGVLVGDHNGSGVSLEPAKPDWFGSRLATETELGTAQFERDASGAISGLILDGELFKPVED